MVKKQSGWREVWFSELDEIVRDAELLSRAIDLIYSTKVIDTRQADDAIDKLVEELNSLIYEETIAIVSSKIGPGVCVEGEEDYYGCDAVVYFGEEGSIIYPRAIIVREERGD